LTLYENRFPMFPRVIAIFGCVQMVFAGGSFIYLLSKDEVKKERENFDPTFDPVSDSDSVVIVTVMNSVRRFDLKEIFSKGTN
jgi:hypothetical protein